MKCRIVRAQAAIQRESLYLYYYPLIGKDACILYEILQCCPEEIRSSDLETLCDLRGSRFVQARKKLEQYRLLRTFVKQDDMVLMIQAPLSPADFLRHDTFGRMYMEAVGSKRFETMKARLQQPDPAKGMKEISEHIDTTMLNRWNQKKEDAYETMRPARRQRIESFRFDVFFQNMDGIFPQKLRTPENLTLIAELASLNGISETDMRKFVNRAINPNKQTFDAEKLKHQIYASRPKVQPVTDRYAMAPVAFLQEKQGDAPVSYADKLLIQRLADEYGFGNDVINTLIEYVLKMTNQKFPTAYVEKVAGTWKRLHVQNREDALAAVRSDPRPQKQNTASVPDWYNDVETEQAGEDLMAKVRRQQQKLKGDGNGTNED
ncbi:DnaD domain protein [Catenisphaera adipataccumulans]|jgi:replication initiation and membrane attachment protein|uniref:Replication initiation and membrane attachment protein n=1 Tax=Catenisphaera adipataccumulans TaxID=700500 RepID=A0A7W8CYL4_9FIRM|nr:DnaD domain protein [Catenisphaera adipataccumulans]MBB5183781.1 replication initiation and membrane attachment protein [Catenisphaera adipataccumulans]